jgi:lysocardiolipin and lysophospholipid acyltransferase
MYITGQPPPSVNMYWRRFAVKDIPLGSGEEFDLWLRERWYEKDALLEQYVSTGRFPPNTASTSNGEVKVKEEAFIETEVKLGHWYEIGNIFVVLAVFGLVFRLLAKAWAAVRG